jgi:FxLD family lantipeptide
MSTPTITPPSTNPDQLDGPSANPFQLDIHFVEGTPESETVLMCGTGDNCGSSCPSACATS